jgi:hypothetical protein
MNNRFTDEQVWSALESVQMKQYVTALPGGISAPIRYIVLYYTYCILHMTLRELQMSHTLIQKLRHLQLMQ